MKTFQFKLSTGAWVNVDEIRQEITAGFDRIELKYLPKHVARRRLGIAAASASSALRKLASTGVLTSDAGRRLYTAMHRLNTAKDKKINLRDGINS